LCGKDGKIQNPGKNALVVLGHGGEAFIIKNKNGSENLEQVTVPEGSLVVIKTHSGDITTTDISVPNYTDALTKENEKYILDPIKYKTEITKLFGSVAIYKPGDKCPNIYHSYLASHDATTGFTRGVSIEQSGIITVPVNPPMNKNDAKKFVETSYEFPANKTLGQYLQDLQNKKGPDIRPLFQHHLKNTTHLFLFFYRFLQELNGH
jgi:hypothetical protein